METEDYDNLIGGGERSEFLFHRQPAEGKKEGHFSLHKNSIDVTQNVVGANYMNSLFSPSF